MPRLKRIITAALALCLVLSACQVQPPIQPEEPAPETPDAPVTQTPEPQDWTTADSVFSINYNPEGSLNPLKGTDYYNEQLFGLLYEGLFALTPELEAVPVLCDTYDTQDGQIWTFTLRSGVLFHDGSPMTLDDVTYSLNIARNTWKYSSRLGDIQSLTVNEQGALQITLKRPNYLFPAMLDVPIVKNGEADAETPQGTGPYLMAGGRLLAFTSHRDYNSHSLGSIYLKTVPTEGLADAFLERTLDLIGYDPTGLTDLNIHMVHEARYYETTDLIYLGFNCAASGVTSDILARRALARLVNGDAICEDCFDSAVRRSPFILNPILGYYTDADAAPYAYSRQEFTRLGMIAGVDDWDQDGYLEYMTEEFALRLIVNAESDRKVAAAQRVASDMQNMGINVAVDALSFEKYEKALSEGDFHMYIGEVQLRADMDPTALFSGDLNYGRVRDPEYAALTDAYLAAATAEERAQAAYNLYIYVAEDASIVPIAYKRHAVLTHVGVVSGAEPSQSGLFNGVLNWSVDLSK